MSLIRVQSSNEQSRRMAAAPAQPDAAPVAEPVPVPDFYKVSEYDLPYIFAQLQERAVCLHDFPATVLKNNAAKENISVYACGRMHTVARHMQLLLDLPWFKKIKTWDAYTFCNCTGKKCDKKAHPVTAALMLFFPLLSTVHDQQQQLKQRDERIQELEVIVAGSQLP